MKIVDTPSELMPRAEARFRRSPTRGRNAEEALLDYVLKHAPEIKTDRAYLPVQWWQCIVEWMNQHPGMKTFEPVPAVQAFLDGLDQTAKYFTVCRGDDGIYERLPPDTVVFNTAGVGDLPIPLLPPG